MSPRRQASARHDRGAWARRHNHALVSLARRVWQDDCTLEDAFALICENRSRPEADTTIVGRDFCVATEDLHEWDEGPLRAAFEAAGGHFAPAKSLTRGRTSVFDASGTSVVIHARPDDHRTDPGIADGGEGRLRHAVIHDKLRLCEYKGKAGLCVKRCVTLPVRLKRG